MSNTKKKEDMSLQELYIHELKDAYSAETQIVKTLPKVIEGIDSTDLKTALKDHLEETKSQVDRLKSIFEAHGESPTGNHCEGMEGLLKEGDEAIEEIRKGPARDAALIAGCQKVEHYEISGYGTLCALAEQLGHKEDVKTLRSIQEEEVAADKKLTEIATSSVNLSANDKTAAASR
ncbi:MAG: ferritin-like domain-containing protein [Fimbriimonadaceae bacterium]|nr:ferritin-like domain-containing protein [Fimbriimonadaceae bacterium]